MTNIGTPEPVRHVPRPATPDSPAELPVTVPAPLEPAVPGPPPQPAPAHRAPAQRAPSQRASAQRDCPSTG